MVLGVPALVPGCVLVVTRSAVQSVEIHLDSLGSRDTITQGFHDDALNDHYFAKRRRSRRSATRSTF
jgi:hypothetical protein